MNILNKGLFSISCLSCALSLYGASDMENRLKELEQKVESISTKTANGNMSAKLGSARAEPEGHGWNLSAAVLYWQTKIAGDNYTVITNGFVDSPINYDLTQRYSSFNWAWGFKVGGGYNFCHDGWETRLEYTYFRNSLNDNVCSLVLPSAVLSQTLDQNTNLLYSNKSSLVAANVNSVKANQARINGKNSYNDLFWDLGRDFFVSQYLSLRPSIGVEATWFTLKRNLCFSGGTTEASAISGGYVTGKTELGLGTGSLKVFNKQKFVGVGPRAGFASKWHLCEGFSIFGNVNGALLFSYLQQYYKNTYTNQTNNQTTYTNDYHRINPTAKFELGIVYDRYIMCDTQHVGVSLAYENQYFWDVYTLNQIPTGVGMYGATLKVQWCF